MIIGVVADDVTGANDIGIMFAKAGYMTHVYAHDHFEDVYRPEVEVCIIDTNSRLDSSEVAYQKVFVATKALQLLGCRQFHNKTCSVFRGNIGAEFDAMLDALEQDFAVVVLGFPKNGRTTVNGIHYVRGTKLEESEFRRDPVHPMTQSGLVDILQAQTKRRVGAIYYDMIERGNLREQLETMKSDYQYVILDITDQEMLNTIAAAVSDYPVLCGSSAIAEELPTHWTKAPKSQSVELPAKNGLGVLCAAGSLMPQTAVQIEHLRKLGTPIFELNPLHLFDDKAFELAGLADEIMVHLRRGENVVFHPKQGSVEQMRDEGISKGLSLTEISRLVSGAIAEVVGKCPGLNRLVIAGGETSAAVCERLNIYGMQVWKEIQPGLPVCISLTDSPLLLVLKSGSFGSPDFFEQAIDALTNDNE